MQSSIKATKNHTIDSVNLILEIMEHYSEGVFVYVLESDTMSFSNDAYWSL